MNEKSHPLCRACLGNLTSSHSCSQCGAKLEGAGNRRCRKCLNEGSIRDLAFKLKSGISKNWIQKLWSNFVESRLSIDEGNPALKRRIIHAFEFFVLLDNKFVMSDEVTEASIIEVIGSEGLRKYLLASRYLIHEFGLKEFDQVREGSIREKRSVVMASKACGQPFQQVLDGYFRSLHSKSISIRTIYSYQRAAQGLCTDAQLRAGAAVADFDVVRYLRKYPGQYACLFPFVTYCREILDWDVSMPHKKLINGEGEALKRRVKKLNSLLVEFKNVSINSRRVKLAARILSISLNTSIAQLVNYKIQHYVDGGNKVDGVRVYWDAFFLMVDPLYPYAKLWIDAPMDLA